jgi:hypothetical protein
MKNLNFLSEKGISLNKSYCFQIYFSGIYWKEILRMSLKLFSDDYYYKLRFSLFGDLFDFNTYWNRRMDHAGFTFDLSLFGLCLHFNIYDNRHWDFIENNWKNAYIDEDLMEDKSEE